MSNNVATPPDAGGIEVETAAPATPAVAQPSVFGSLERMDVKRDPTSAIISTVINVTLVALFLWFATRQVMIATQTKKELVSLDVPPPPKAPPKAQLMGGGGGQKGPAPVSKGNIPPPSPQQLNPPKARVEDAKLPAPVTVDIDKNIKMAHVDTLNFGMPTAPNVGTSLGNGNGNGIGSGNGSGVGPGSGGNMGGGVRRPGGGVSRPEPLYTPEPEFSEEARKAKFMGNVLVYIQVDTNGRPINIRVLKPVGMGLDEKALEAVRQYRFKPAMENGHPVVVEMQVEVNFQIF